MFQQGEFKEYPQLGVGAIIFMKYVGRRKRLFRAGTGKLSDGWIQQPKCNNVQGDN
jgi:hypothetical protein